jgi:hypothetical protein
VEEKQIDSLQKEEALEYFLLEGAEVENYPGN